VDLEEVGRSILDWIPGAIGIVSLGGEPASVPDHLISALQQHLETIKASNNELPETLRPGEPVVIQGGPFAGYEAIFNARLSGRKRVEVLLKMLQGSQIRVQLSIEQISSSASASSSKVKKK
jgi:transcriptional antiterminator RfaH